MYFIQLVEIYRLKKSVKNLPLYRAQRYSFCLQTPVVEHLGLEKYIAFWLNLQRGFCWYPGPYLDHHSINIRLPLTEKCWSEKIFQDENAFKIYALLQPLQLPYISSMISQIKQISMTLLYGNKTLRLVYISSYSSLFGKRYFTPSP